MSIWANVTAAGAAALLAVALGVPQNVQQTAAPQYGPPLATATVVLSSSRTGCDKVLVGNDSNPTQLDRLHARNGSIVRWNVFNLNCAAPVDVAIDFGANSPGPPGAPLTCTVQAAQPFCIITMPVRDNATGPGVSTTYAYHMLINGTQKDPVIIIDP